MSQKMKGMLYAALSAFFFGWSSVLTKMITVGNVSIPSILLFRGVVGACLLLPLARHGKQSLRLPFFYYPRILYLSAFGTALTLLMLNLSYIYMPVGSATTIHYLYPAVVILLDSFISRQKPDKLTVTVLILCTASIALLFEGFAPGAYVGLLFAGISVFTWSFQLIYLDRSCLRQVPIYALAFYQSCMVALIGLATGIAVPHTWGAALVNMPLILLIGLLNNVLATLFLRAGIERIGAGMAAVLSVFEPISAILFGALMLREKLSFIQLLVSAIVLISITLLVWLNARREKRQPAEKISLVAREKGEPYGCGEQKTSLH